MPGSVVLCGGNEFEQESLTLSKAVLRLVRSNQPRVVILPVAATDNPRKAARSGVGHFNALGARTEAMMIANRETADDAIMSAGVETADAAYLTDGIPLDAVETLTDSEVLMKLRHFWGKGMVLAASGGAAMALCDVYWDSGIWEPGLGVFKGIAVLPHYEIVAGRYSAERLREKLPAGYTILGIDDSTGVIITGQDARVVGPDVVTVYGPDSETEYENGQTFKLDTPLD